MTHPTWGDKPPRVPGSLPPMRPDQELQLAITRAGSGPAPQTSIILARIVLVGGGSPFGVFVYDPTIGAGNLIGWMTDSATDPFGNETDAVIGTQNNATGAETFLSKNADIHLSAPLFTGDGVWGASQQGTGTPAYTAPWMSFISPEQSGSSAQMRFTMLGGDSGTTKGPFALLGWGDASSAKYGNQQCWYVPGTTGVDDGAAINLLLGLGIKAVTVLPGTASLASVAITPDTDQVVRGCGKQTKFVTTAAFTDTYMFRPLHPTSSGRIELRDFEITNAFALNASSGTVGGIQLDYTGWVGSGGVPDPAPLVDNVWIVECSGDGIHMDNRCREAIVRGCKIYSNLGNGMYGGNAAGAGDGLTDSHFLGNTCGNNALNGLELLGGNCMFAGNKWFGSGNNQSTGIFASTTYNVHLNGAAGRCNFNVFDGDSCQQAGLHNWFLDQCGDCSVSGCESDSAGAGAAVPVGYGMLINATTRCSVTGLVGNNSQTPGNQVNGIAVQGVNVNTWIAANSCIGTGTSFLNVGGATGYYLLDGPTITDLTGLNNFRFGAPVFFETGLRTFTANGQNLAINQNAGTYPVTATLVVTGIVAAAWTRGGGGTVNVINIGTNAITFAATSVFGGPTLNGGQVFQLVWDANNSLWYAH